MKMVLEMLAGLEGGLDGEGAPLPHSDMGRRYQMPAYGLALEWMGIARSMSRKGNCLDSAKAENFFSLLRLGGRRPRYLREGFGEVLRLVRQRAHQETPERKQLSRVQTRPGRLIHFFCRSGNGVLCIDSAQFHCIDVVGMDFQL